MRINNKISKKITAVMLCAAMTLGIAGCGSKEYPSEQINMVIHAAAGGGSDSMARVVASVMEEKLGVPVVCENKTGASGSVAMQYVANSKPDGYTIGTAPCELSMIEPLGYAQLNPDDVELLGMCQSWAAALTVPADAPYNTLDEFIAYAKEHPGELTVGNSGTGSIWHIAACILEKEAGIELNHVPFDGATGAVSALLGKHCDAITVGATEASANVLSGELKCLAVFNDSRSTILPDVPTTAELGYEKIKAIVWVGMLGPKGIEDGIKSKLVAGIKEAVESDAFHNFCTERGTDWNYMSPEDFKKMAMEDYEYYQQLIPELGISAQ